VEYISGLQLMTAYKRACDLAKMAPLSQSDVLAQCDMLDSKAILTIVGTTVGGGGTPRHTPTRRRPTTPSTTGGGNQQKWTGVRIRFLYDNIFCLQPQIRLLMDTDTARQALNDETLIGAVLNSL
jgi:hypothetical protein